VDWLRIQIAKKEKKYTDADQMILAVDLGSLGHLAVPEVVSEYLRSYPDPCKEFASALLVGPTENHVMPLGAGRW